MTGAAAGAAAGGGAAAAAAIAQAIKASGAIVQMEPDEFRRILDHLEDPLVVVAPAWGGAKYAVSHKGLVFWCKAKEPIGLPSGARTIQAKRFWAP